MPFTQQMRKDRSMHRVQVMGRKTHHSSAEVAVKKRLDSIVKSVPLPNNTWASSYESSSVANGNLSSDGLRSIDHDESNHLSKIKIT